VLFGFRARRVIDIDEDPVMTFKPITDEGDLYKINEISGMLEVDETILLVIRQSKIRFVGFRFSPNVIYATDRRLILRNNSLLGLKEDIIGIPYTSITNVFQENTFISTSVRLSLRQVQDDNQLSALNQTETPEGENEWLIEHIPKNKAANLVLIIKSRKSKRNFLPENQRFITEPFNNDIAAFRPVDSPADELLKIAKLKNDGIISEQEFIRLKQIIIERIH
jgi:hypothetical protein